MSDRQSEKDDENYFMYGGCCSVLFAIILIVAMVSAIIFSGCDGMCAPYPDKQYPHGLGVYIFRISFFSIAFLSAIAFMRYLSRRGKI